MANAWTDDDAGTNDDVRTHPTPGAAVLTHRSRGAGTLAPWQHARVDVAAELVLDHGWPVEALDAQDGAFDLLGRSGGRVVLAVAATGGPAAPDGPDGLLAAWSTYGTRPSGVPHTAAGRRYRELLAHCSDGPVSLWLVAPGARRAYLATAEADGLSLRPLDGAPVPPSALVAGP